MSNAPWTIVGQGLAGTCLAWQLWQRKVPFLLVDSEQGGSSRVAAGLINPVTGKNFQPSSGIAEFLPRALDFYAGMETTLGRPLWHPLPILRLAAADKEWQKMQNKAALPEVAGWLAGDGQPQAEDGWLGAYQITGGGRLDTRAFLDGSRDYFREHGCYETAHIAPDEAPPHTVWCDGSSGLISGRYGPHRCAKGEILTVEAKGWDENHIRIGAGGWCIPIRKGQFKVGATYEWEQLDHQATTAGREKVESIARRLGGPEFTVIDHQAGIRPILRRSEPLIGPLGDDQWMFNALGSKGSLYAPDIAAQLADWLVHDQPCDPHYDYRLFQA